jgi:hypothetical protein
MKKIVIGDIFEITTPKGKAYLYFIYRHENPKTGRELARVLPGLHTERPESFDRLAGSKEQFMVFFPVSAASKKKIIEKVGHYPAHRFPKPKYTRSEHSVREEFLGWHIIDTDTWKMKLVKELTAEQKLLSDWATWNDTLLIERLIEGWSLKKWP